MNHVPSAPELGNPVNAIQGTVALAADDDQDFILEGPLPLSWQRSYLSSNSHSGWFGRGWSSPLEMRLEEVPDASGSFVDHVEYVDTFGRRVAFPPLAPGAVHTARAERITLHRDTEGRYSVRFRDGLTYSFAEESDGLHGLASIADRNGNELTLRVQSISGRSKVLLLKGSGDQVLSLRFESERLVDVTDIGGGGGATRSVVRYEYSPQRQLRRVIDSSGRCRREFGYGEHELLESSARPGALETWFEYERTGMTTRVRRFGDNVDRSWTLDYLDRQTVVEDQDGRQVAYHFDDRRRWIGFTDAAGHLTRYGLDTDGNLRSLVRPDECFSETRYDEAGNPVEIIDMDGSRTLIDWAPALGVPIAVTDTLGRAYRYGYDERANLVEQTDPSGATTRFVFDRRGLVSEIINALGGTTHLEYNARAQLVRHVDCSGMETLFEYGADSLLDAVVNAAGERTTFAYDASGRLVRQTLGDGSFERYDYDPPGRLIAVTDALERTIRYEYSPDDRVVRRIDANGGVLRYDYDRARNLVGLVDENGAIHRLEYDSLDRVTRETRIDGTERWYEYDVAGEVSAVVEGRNGRPLARTDFRRNMIGDVLERRNGACRASFEYDEAGRLVRGISGAVRLALSYDLLDHVVEEAVSTDARTFVLRHEYDELGHRVGTVLPDGRRINWLLYGCGHVHRVGIGKETISDIERDALHREVLRTQGELQTGRRYDGAGRIAQIRARQSQSPDPGTSVIEREFAYYANGFLARARDRGRILEYGYDRVDRLTRFNEERFAFDPAGNIVGFGEPAPSARIEDGRVVVAGACRYRYDDLGRVVEKSIGANTHVHLKWDETHRLVESTRSTPESSATTKYLYDPFGRRVCKRGPVGETWYLWDGDQLLQELGGDATTTFVYEDDSFTPLAQIVDLPGAQEIRYYHCDQVGMPRELTDSLGNIVWEAEYHGWGRVARVRAAPASAPGATTSGKAMQPFRMQGQYEDDETGLYYNHHRYYDPDCLRFLTPDPIGLEGGPNLYTYAPNPVHWIDPLGTAGEDVKWGKHLRSCGGGEPPASMNNPHAHHIVFKNGRGKLMRKYLRESKAILKRFGIDYLYGKENLIWAPNKNHSTDAAKVVRDELVAEAAKPGCKKEDIVKVLRRNGRRFKNDTISNFFK